MIDKWKWMKNKAIETIRKQAKVLREKKTKIGSALASDEIELFRCRRERENFGFFSLPNIRSLMVKLAAHP